MPIDPTLVAEAGPWAVVVAVLVGIIVGGATALRRRWFVPGWIFERAEKRAMKAETAARLNAKSLASLSAAYTVMARSYDRIEQALDTALSGAVKRD